jgi:hypothetical protein
MVRAVPGAIPRLDRLLAGPRRPTWLVRWQSPGEWRLDPHGTTRRLIGRRYRRVAKVAGHGIYLRRDVAAARHIPRYDGRSPA